MATIICNNCQETISSYSDACFDGDKNELCDKCNAVMTQGNLPAFEVGTYEGSCGDSIQVPVVVKGNPGIAAIKMKIAYDSSRIELTSVTYGSWSGSFQQPQRLSSPVSLTWYNGAENYTEPDSTFAVLNFTVLKEAQNGDAAISITYEPDNVYNIQEDNIAFLIKDGKISVKTKTVGVALLESTASTAKISFSNCTKNAIRANYIVAAYAVNEKMIGIETVFAEVDSKESVVLNVSCASDERIVKLKGFVLAEDTYLPLFSGWETRI